MYAPDPADTFWLDFTNIALALVTLACLIVVLGGVARELGHRPSRRKRPADDHAFDTPGLGESRSISSARASGYRPLSSAEGP